MTTLPILGKTTKSYTHITIIHVGLRNHIAGHDHLGKSQNLERPNVERPIFWKFKIVNIK